MLDSIKKLFGEGKIRMEMEFADGTTGIGKLAYIGSLDMDTLDEQELKLEMANRMLVEHGLTLTKLRILGAY